MAGALGFALIAAPLHFGRSTDRTGDFGYRIPDLPWWMGGLGTGVFCALCAPAAALMPARYSLSRTMLRMAAALNPTWCGLGSCLLCNQSGVAVPRMAANTRRSRPSAS